jgi:hypothetical protein
MNRGISFLLVFNSEDFIVKSTLCRRLRTAILGLVCCTVVVVVPLLFTYYISPIEMPREYVALIGSYSLRVLY